MRYVLALATVCCTAHGLLNVAWSKPIESKIDAVVDHASVDRVGDVDGTDRRVSKAALDTIWIADWTFDGAGGVCDDTGWEAFDRRILNDGQIYWDGDDSRFDGVGGIAGEAAVLSDHDPCWVFPDGYGNDWYQAIRIEYTGESFLSFDYVLDAQDIRGTDFLRVEVDSACSSFSRVDYSMDPGANASALRTTEFSVNGLNIGRVNSLRLRNFDSSLTHCAFIAFFSNTHRSSEDGFEFDGTAHGIGLAVDNISMTGGTAVVEDFEGTMHPALSFVNIQDTQPFGVWARLFPHVTDNDVCTENTTCAWLFTDDTTPTIATTSEMAYGPGAYVIRNWLDNTIVGPWVGLHDRGGSSTFITFREFRGNSFGTSRIVRNWSVRGRGVDTTPQGEPIDCTWEWGHQNWWHSLGNFRWINTTQDMTPFFDSRSTEIQVRFRVSDWQWVVGASPPPLFNPGPGPFIDRVRIGQVALSGPVFDQGLDRRYQAHDGFPTEIHPFIDPSLGEHHRPTTSRFGSTAFSAGHDLGLNNTSPKLITADSITMGVFDRRDAGGIHRVEWHGSVVSGLHTGKAPAPWTVGTNGFFVVPADSSRDNRDGTVIEGRWFVDLDDAYFSGGDVLRYFWLAEDELGGTSSYPPGLSGAPSSRDDAEELTGGLLEVSFLPTIDWDPAYAARVAADPHGKLEPTSEETANSSQANCILYYQLTNTARESGEANRTSFMYTLDRLGYRDHYDVYDVLGSGNTNNQLGGRTTVEQAAGYALIIQDTGRKGTSLWALPDGSNNNNAKVDQAGWYRTWLALANTSETEKATLWLIGSTLAEVIPTNPLLEVEMGVEPVSADVLPTVGANPDVTGQASFTFANASTADFSNDAFTVQAACPNFPPYNGLDASGSAVVTHRWANDNSAGDGAIVMNANPPQSWNTIMQVPTWREMRFASGPSSPEADLMAKILGGVLPADDIQHPDPTTDVRDDADELDALPKVTALYQNAPNPFNPMTTIRFDLSSDGHVDLRVYDVSGRLVRTLVNSPMERQRHEIVWDGLDNAGKPVSSGIYFYRLEAAGFRDTRKMVVLR